MKIRNLIIVAAVAIAAGCGGNSKKAEQFAALPFPDVVPPAMMEDASDRAEYMALHWWDGITDPSRTYPCDSSLVSGVRLTDVEQKMANWTNVLNMVDISVAGRSFGRLYERAVSCEKKDTSSNVFETFVKLTDKYLYDPNSPLRNEDHYAFFASHLASSDLVEPLMQEKYARIVRLAALNRVGTKAADFRFADKRGRFYTLYGIDAAYVGNRRAASIPSSCLPTLK